jgi:hypothetical protein
MALFGDNRSLKGLDGTLGCSCLGRGHQGRIDRSQAQRFTTRNFIQGFCQRFHILEALVTILGHGLFDDELKIRRQVRHDIQDVRNRVCDVLDHHAHGSVAMVRLLPTQELKQDDTQPIDITAAIDALALSLLRAHVGRRPYNGTTGDISL